MAFRGASASCTHHRAGCYKRGVHTFLHPCALAHARIHLQRRAEIEYREARRREEEEGRLLALYLQREEVSVFLCVSELVSE